MTIRFDNGYYDSARSLAIVIAIFAGLITFAVLAWIFAIYVKRMDNKKALIVKRGKVIEKMPSVGKVGWYMVEFEDGGRAKLRSYKENTVPIAPGDVGIFRYRGMTIEGFQREGMGMPGSQQQFTNWK